MSRFLKGSVFNFTSSIVGVLTNNFSSISDNSIYFAESISPDLLFIEKPIAIVSRDAITNNVSIPQLFNTSNFGKLKNNDIVVIHCDGTLNILFDSESIHNSLLVTEMCNSNCLMCSQPPKFKNDIDYLNHINIQCINLIPKNCKYLGITGGEPTLLGPKLFELLRTINEVLPNTEIQILSNGRLFSDLQFTRELANSISNNVIFCIPLYSDYYSLHDYIVQSKGAFHETLAGLHNLARYNVRTEIRIVIQKATHDRLINISHFIYKNMPFVEHVAFMGLENEGYTPHNIDKLWIEPHLFINQLEEAVLFLASRGIRVSIYNLQLCLLPNILWNYARQSISDWKNIFIDECNNCGVKSSCAGLFSSSKELYRPYIKPFL